MGPEPSGPDGVDESGGAGPPDAERGTRRRSGCHGLTFCGPKSATTLFFFSTVPWLEVVRRGEAKAQNEAVHGHWYHGYRSRSDHTAPADICIQVDNEHGTLVRALLRQWCGDIAVARFDPTGGATQGGPPGRADRGVGGRGVTQGGPQAADRAIGSAARYPGGYAAAQRFTAYRVG